MKLFYNSRSYNKPFVPMESLSERSESLGRMEGYEHPLHSPSQLASLLRRFYRGERGKFFLLFLFLFFCVDIYGWFDYDRGIQAAQKNDWATSRALLEKAVSDQPDRPELIYDLGVSAYRNKEYDTALHYFLSAAQHKKSPSALQQQAHFNAGNTQVQLKELQKAIDQYDEVLTLNPAHKEAQENKEIVKKMLEEQKKQEQEKQNKDKNQKDQDEKKDKEQDKKEQQQQKDQQQSDSDQQDKKSKQDDSSSENNKNDGSQNPNNQKDQESQQQDQQSKSEQDKKNKEEQERQAQEKSAQEKQRQEEQRKKEQAAAQEAQKEEERKKQEAAAGQEENEQEEKKEQLPASYARILDAFDHNDAKLNKKMMKARATAGKGGASHVTHNW